MTKYRFIKNTSHMFNAGDIICSDCLTCNEWIMEGRIEPEIEDIPEPIPVPVPVIEELDDNKDGIVDKKDIKSFKRKVTDRIKRKK